MRNSLGCSEGPSIKRTIDDVREVSRREKEIEMLDEIINGCFAFMVLVMLGCFAAGSVEISSERAEKRRVEKLIRERYGRTY